jgi:phosphoribosylamine--glycine ligase
VVGHGEDLAAARAAAMAGAAAVTFPGAQRRTDIAAAAAGPGPATPAIAGTGAAP